MVNIMKTGTRSKIRWSPSLRPVLTEPNPRVPRHKFVAEFKAHAVRLAINSQTVIAQSAQESGNSDTLLCAWPAATEQAEAAMQRLYAALAPALRELREG